MGIAPKNAIGTDTNRYRAAFPGTKHHERYDKLGILEIDESLLGESFMLIKAINLRLAMGRRTGVMLAVRTAMLIASSFWILLAGPLALYPGAQLDQEFEREQ